jgi:hypothetical protein
MSLSSLSSSPPSFYRSSDQTIINRKRERERDTERKRKEKYIRSLPFFSLLEAGTASKGRHHGTYNNKKKTT